MRNGVTELLLLGSVLVLLTNFDFMKTVKQNTVKYILSLCNERKSRFDMISK